MRGSGFLSADRGYGYSRVRQIALVEVGEGVAILPQGWSFARGNEVVFVPLGDRMAFHDLVIAWAPQHENPVLRSFLELALKKRKRP